MGAWGEGHQCNDTALDYIECNKRLLKQALRKKKIGPKLTKEFQGGQPQGVLGMTEWLLDNGFNKFGEVREHIDRAIKFERSDLADWVDPMARANCLDWLEDRLEGRLDINTIPDEVKEANRGLLERLFGALE